MKNTAELLEDSLLVIWNDRNAQQRIEAMKKIYAEDIAFYESDAGPALVGYVAINELIAKLQEQWPADFQFELTQSSQVNHQVQHITWKLGVPGQTPAASGSDIAIVEEDKIKSLYLFLNTSLE